MGQQQPKKDLRELLRDRFLTADMTALSQSLLTSAHENFHAFMTECPFRLDGKEELERLVKSQLAEDGSSREIFFHQPALEVYGETAVLLSYFEIAGYTEGGVLYHRYGQLSATFVQEGNDLKLVALHTSPLIEGVTEAGFIRRAYAGLAHLRQQGQRTVAGRPLRPLVGG